MVLLQTTSQNSHKLSVILVTVIAVIRNENPLIQTH